MKNSKILPSILLFACICLQTGGLEAQEITYPGQDATQTLDWVGRQAQQIDKILSDAMLMVDPFEIYLRLADSYVLFDAVAMAGVYCTEVRAAAEKGREHCDILHFRLGKDLNSKLQRAVDARLAAHRMLEASKACSAQTRTAEGSRPQGFRPGELLKHDAQLAVLDIQDGLASRDMHILSQKLEHAIRLLFDAKTLASTLENCPEASAKAEAAILYCQKALGATNWTEVYRFSQSAIKVIQGIQDGTECN